jgi:hypothetical protein
MARSDRICAAGQSNRSVVLQVHNNFDLAGKTMNVARFVILRICDEFRAPEATR